MATLRPCARSGVGRGSPRPPARSGRAKPAALLLVPLVRGTQRNSGARTSRGHCRGGRKRGFGTSRADPLCPGACLLMLSAPRGLAQSHPHRKLSIDLAAMASPRRATPRRVCPRQEVGAENKLRLWSGQSCARAGGAGAASARAPRDTARSAWLRATPRVAYLPGAPAAVGPACPVSLVAARGARGARGRGARPAWPSRGAQPAIARPPIYPAQPRLGALAALAAQRTSPRAN